MIEYAIFYSDRGQPTTAPDPSLIKHFQTVHALCHYRGHWLLSVMDVLPDVPELPGGRADPGENLWANLQREFHEETGLHFPPDIERYVRARHRQMSPFHAKMVNGFFVLDQTYLLIDWPESLADHTPPQRSEWRGPEDNRLVWTPDADMDRLTQTPDADTSRPTLRYEHKKAFLAMHSQGK